MGKFPYKAENDEVRPLAANIFNEAFERVLKKFKIACDLRIRKFQRLKARVPAYTLPDPLITNDSIHVESAKSWYEQRRPEIIELFRANVYGHSWLPARATAISITSSDENALNGHATRKEVRVGLKGRADFPSIKLLLYLPNKIKKQGMRVPVFLGLNFYGNQTILIDPAISINKSWVPKKPILKGKAPDKLRGIDSSSWPVEFVLEHGYGLATAYCGDIVPDRRDGLYLSILKWCGEEADNIATDSWGAIGGWAWGLSRAMDYIEQDEELDANKVAVMGHSRLGKAALWAGAQDERFAIVISNESGCGGAALSKRKFGESVAEINSSFPHWFCEHFKHYNDREEALPVDQHELIALIAPRPVYVASARLDLDADPMGEFLATKHASPVYRLLGTSGLPAEELPAVNVPVMGTMGYHIRTGRHGITLFDWSRFIEFADMHFKNK